LAGRDKRYHCLDCDETFNDPLDALEHQIFDRHRIKENLL
jgi:hypothetical protein